MEYSNTRLCSGYLNKSKPCEHLENMPVPQRGKVISGTFGTFSIKEFENVAGGLKDV